MSRIMVAMSGGVDSSVAALILKEQGHEILGATMALWSYDDVGGRAAGEESCCSLASIEDARKVCWKLGIRHHVFGLRDAFQEQVVDDFCNQYQKGFTPNPCVRCNARIKWDSLLARARELDYAYLATGHYANLIASPEGVEIRKGLDRAKDQSYFLWAVSEQAWRATVLPLGSFTKPEIRRMAHRAGLPVADKAESQEVCFVPDQDYHRFFEEQNKRFGHACQPGDIVDMQGKAVGRHKGLPNYTIGQRKGIGHHHAQRKYVVALDADANRVIIGDEADLYRRRFSIEEMNWLGIPPIPGEEIRCGIRVRYRQSEQPGVVAVHNGCAWVTYDQPQRAISPGQSAVFYADDRLLGGGVIQQVFPESKGNP